MLLSCHYDSPQFLQYIAGRGPSNLLPLSKQFCKMVQAVVPGHKADLMHTNGLSTGLNVMKQSPLFLNQSAAQLIYCTHGYNYAWCGFPISLINSAKY